MIGPIGPIRRIRPITLALALSFFFAHARHHKKEPAANQDQSPESSFFFPNAGL
jgi:hypothetical protein